MNVENKRRVGTFVALILGMAFLVPAVSSGSDADTQYLLAHFPAIPDSNAINALQSTGVEIMDYMGDGTYLVRLPGAISRDSLLSHMADSISLYPVSLKLNPELDGVTGTVPLRVELHDGEDPQAIVSILESLGAEIVKVNTDSVTYIRCTVDSAAIPSIISLNPVISVHHDPQPESFMSLITSNTYMGHDAVQAGSFRGSGMLGEVQDNGIDRTHVDLQNVDFTDGSVAVDDHGTCTTGIVFGTGTGDINAQGIAYQAIGAFSDWGTGRATSIANLWNGDFNEGMAGNNGVMQSNSWSSGVQDGLYQTLAAEEDAALVNYPHVLALWAAGNGNDGTNEGEISEDAIAKNVIGVGAIFHKNTAVMTDDDWILQSAGNTPSRGPAADGRQKPDMCGPFDWIYTVDGTGSLGYTTTNYYDNFGGTSGATPIVAGSSLLAYQMYKENYFGNNPTNAIPYSSTIKALMIADAFQYPLTGTYSATRNEQGWGTPDMEKMYNLGAIYHQIDEYPQAMSSGSIWTRQVYADAVNPLKITLSWIDPAAPSTTNAARALRNNLDLKVTSPSGVIYYGNNGLWDSLYSVSGTVVNRWSTSSSYRDDLNNLENVFIQTPQVGIWTIEVSGRTGDIALGPQHFSLVSSGAQIPVPSAGMIDIENDIYRRESVVTIELLDRDLNTNIATAQTVNVNLKSNAEPAGETTLLTETGPDTSIFRGTKTISATNSAGVLMVNAADTITATYNDANDGTGSPAVATDTAVVDGTAPTAPALNEVDNWGPATQSSSTTDIRYMRGDTHTVNTLTAYQLGTAQSSITGGGTARTQTGGKLQAVVWGIRAWKRTSAGVETELTGGSMKATVSRTADGAGIQSNTWDCPGIALATTDSVVIRVYDQIGTGAVTQRAEFTSVQLAATNLDAVTWTVYYYTQRTTGGAGANSWTGSAFWWGTTTYNSRVENFQYTVTVSRDPYQDNTLNWSASPSVDVDHYNVYRATVSGGPYSLIGASPVGTNTYVDSLKGAADATLWWYRVTAVDVAGNEGAVSANVQELGGAITPNPYAISLAGKVANSWVFISFPSGLTGNIQTLLNDATAGDGLTTWTIARWYNPQTPNDPWKIYRVGGTANDMPVTITNGMGFWLYITANGGDQQLTLSSYAANPVSPVNINLYAGWNMVGYPSATNRLASATLPAQADMVSVWQAASPYIIDFAPGSVTMSHGNAYWIRVTADCVWTVNP